MEDCTIISLDINDSPLRVGLLYVLDKYITFAIPISSRFSYHPQLSLLTDDITYAETWLADVPFHDKTAKTKWILVDSDKVSTPAKPFRQIFY